MDIDDFVLKGNTIKIDPQPNSVEGLLIKIKQVYFPKYCRREGYILILKAGLNAVLVVSTTKDVRLGLIFLDCKRTCEKIAKLFRNGFDSDDEDLKL